MASSIIIGHKSSPGLFLKPYPRSQALPWNPIANLAISNCKNQITFWGNAAGVRCGNQTHKNPFVVYANTVPGAPAPPGPPSSSHMSWILGFVVSFILPFFTNKWGPLWIVKNRIDNAVQTVENIVETVEKVAEGVDKFAENVAHDLPQGKLRDLVELVEDVAEKTAATADCIDNVIDTVQEAEDQVEDMVESIVEEAKSSPEEAKSSPEETTPL